MDFEGWIPSDKTKSGTFTGEVTTPWAIHHVAIIASALATFRPYHAARSLFCHSPSPSDTTIIPAANFAVQFIRENLSRLRLDFIGNSSATMTTTTDNTGIIYCRRSSLITLVIDCDVAKHRGKLCINLCGGTRQLVSV